MVSKDTITVLTCCEHQTRATKKFTVDPSGGVVKEDYNSGRLFSYEERTVSGLSDMHDLITQLGSEPLKFVIRGKPLTGMPEIVRRRSNGEGKAFESQLRHWVMLDTDKAPYPESLDIQADPDSVVRFLKGLLPENLQRAQCVYQFSSSQSVPRNINEPPAKVASAHLWFWCERPVSDQEWKNYLKSQDTKVDLSVFSAVQPHYTANPVFEGMNDPLPRRIGIC